MSLFRPNSPYVRAAIAALALSTATLGGLAQPARADSLANILLGALAATAPNIVYNTSIQNTIAPNTVIGHTSNGGTLYSDGRVVYPNGDVLYTSAGNGRPCSYTSTYNRCPARPAVYYPRNYAGHDHGNHYGWYKHPAKTAQYVPVQPHYVVPVAHPHHADRDDVRVVKQKHANGNHGEGNGHGNGHGHDKD